MGKDKSREQTDESLLLQYREGDRAVLDELFGRYKDMVRIKARSMFILGGDNDDLIQEGMIGLLKAVRDYDASQGSSFHSFAELCISRQIYTAVQSANRKKHSPLNHYVSIYRDRTDETGGGEDLLSVLEASESFDPEKLMIDRENVSRIYRMIDQLLSPLEKQVLDLKLTGMNYTQIAAVLEREPKSVDNAIGRIKKKLGEKLL
ncbi:MAG: RNA polymerase sporulation sigma factor SigH [Lachnospiraceae bacterium]|nr:RNA polymerase sporulation sigma factor SigH [Lachnospiraceae bacterium]